jgi:hypothetical protein
MYLVWLPPGTSPTEVRTTMLDGVAPRLLDLGLHGLTMDLDDEDAQVASPVPAPEGEHTPDAIVSIWVDAYDHRAPFEAVLDGVAVRVAGYQVLESLYCDYGGNRHSASRDWKDGERSPGLLTVALLEHREDLSFEEWITFWHTRQSPMSEAVQPRCRYVRNSVFRALTEEAPPWRGIVEEAWPSAGHIVDPMLFYCGEGDEARLNANLTTMLEHVSAFLDLSRLRSLTMSEWILHSGPSAR